MSRIHQMLVRQNMLSFKQQFGPFIKCPECNASLKKCGLCNGRGKVIQEDIDNWNNYFSTLWRELQN